MIQSSNVTGKQEIVKENDKCSKRQGKLNFFSKDLEMSGFFNTLSCAKIFPRSEIRLQKSSDFSFANRNFAKVTFLT